MKLSLWCCAAVMVATPVAACSDDESFEDEAAEICDRSAEDIQVASAQLTQQSTAEQVAAFLHDTYVPLLRQRIDALRALEAPDDVAADVDAALDDYEVVVDAIEADPTGFSQRVDDPFAQADARFDQLGLSACGSRPGD